nr:hypothetical protein [Clostridia bacterium]
MQNQTMAKRNNRKRRIAVIAVLAVCVAVLASGTMAYYYAPETAYNVITTESLSMKLHDETTGGKPFPQEGINNIAPGMVVDKLVYVENNGGVDFWTRISLEQTIIAAEGVDAELSFEHIALNINTDAWQEQDGYYYYYKAVAPGEQTEPLFTTVTFEPAMGNEYMDARVEIVVNAQTVQSRNNGDSALTASGWSE